VCGVCGVQVFFVRGGCVRVCVVCVCVWCVCVYLVCLCVVCVCVYVCVYTEVICFKTGSVWPLCTRYCALSYVKVQEFPYQLSIYKQASPFKNKIEYILLTDQSVTCSKHTPSRLYEPISSLFRYPYKTVGTQNVRMNV